MEKKPYTVEWLSESSHKKKISTTVPDVHLLKCRMEQDVSFGKEHNIFSGMEKPTGGEDLSEKENHIESRNALNRALNTAQDTSGISKSRKTFQEISAQRPSPMNEEGQISDSDSMKSPGSIPDESSSTHRTKFTVEQQMELERTFREHPYIGSSEKKRLSKVLRLSETQVKTWFQNRRMKHKRQCQEASVNAFISRLYRPCYDYSGFQPPTYSVQPDLSVPLAPPAPVRPTSVYQVPVCPAPTHPYVALPTPVVRPAFHAAHIASPNFGPYPYPPTPVNPLTNGLPIPPILGPKNNAHNLF